MDELEVAAELATEAGRLAVRHQSELGGLAVGKKGRLDFVTRADQEVEVQIVAGIKARFPDDGIIGEEGQNSPGTSGRTWVIDPIDGTHNFLRGMPSWGISIGVFARERPLAGVICAPAMNVTFAAAAGRGAWRNGERYQSDVSGVIQESTLVFTGVSVALPTTFDAWLSTFVRDRLQMGERRTGSATSALLAVMEGHADLYVGFGEKLWDIAAAVVILEEIGLAHSFEWARDVGRNSHDFICGRPELVARARSEMAISLPPRSTAHLPSAW